MLGEPKNQVFLTRGATSTGGRTKGRFLSLLEERAGQTLVKQFGLPAERYLTEGRFVEELRLEIEREKP